MQMYIVVPAVLMAVLATGAVGQLFDEPLPSGNYNSIYEEEPQDVLRSYGQQYQPQQYQPQQYQPQQYQPQQYQPQQYQPQQPQQQQYQPQQPQQQHYQPQQPQLDYAPVGGSQGNGFDLYVAEFDAYDDAVADVIIQTLLRQLEQQENVRFRRSVEAPAQPLGQLIAAGSL